MNFPTTFSDGLSRSHDKRVGISKNFLEFQKISCVLYPVFIHYPGYYVSITQLDHHFKRIPFNFNLHALDWKLNKLRFHPIQRAHPNLYGYKSIKAEISLYHMCILLYVMYILYNYVSIVYNV